MTAMVGQEQKVPSPPRGEEAAKKKLLLSRGLLGKEVGGFRVL